MFFPGLTHDVLEADLPVKATFLENLELSAWLLSTYRALCVLGVGGAVLGQSSLHLWTGKHFAP